MLLPVSSSTVPVNEGIGDASEQRRHRRILLRLDPNDGDLPTGKSKDQPCSQSTAANRTDDRGDFWELLEDFRGQRRLASDDRRVVVGGEEHCTTSLREVEGEALSFAVVSPVLNERCPECSQLRNLDE